MSAVYPATCGICGRVLASERDIGHMGICFVANQSGRRKPLCPECKTGKHGNCDGTAWDDYADQLTDCNCEHYEEDGGVSEP